MGRDFIFGSADFTDDDAFLSHSSAAQIGEIRSKLFPTNVEMIRPDVPGIDCPDSSKIHERLKKGCDHQIKYSEAKSIIPRGTCYQANLWPLDDPVIFIFKYRPLEMLQANGIALRPPPAQCLDGKDENDKESDDENDEIVKKERTLLAALEEVRGLKRSRNEIDRPTKRIKTEHSEIKYSPPQAVDLTGEQDGLRSLSSGRHVEVIDLTL
ncbi:hypothetical protein BDN70DRAFT_186477 [Pholiota conissans]|uniref:DUF7918 domain-containing protein n=1 Tax=Pholiota conissans TaxID=109636 RepID=A0A9P6CQT4_9AGAR|nr:hypothetical protein BDN70DRAFT_186477 [Pholiota conissans]